MSRRTDLETHLVMIGVVLRWASPGAELCVHSDCFLKQQISGSGCCGFTGVVGRRFLGSGSPVVGCDLCVVCKFSGGYVGL